VVMVVGVEDAVIAGLVVVATGWVAVAADD
jgi:hypothetical protein